MLGLSTQFRSWRSVYAGHPEKGYLLLLCNIPLQLVSDLDRRQPVLFPQILKTHYALLQKVSVPSLKTGESEA